MTNANTMAAEMLERGASGFGRRATDRLFDETEGISGNQRDWHHHLSQRVLELSAALAANDPAMFVSRVVWSRNAFVARGLDDGQLRESLICLRAAVCDALPEDASATAGRYLDTALEAVDADQVPEDSMLDVARKEHKLALEYLHMVLSGNVVAGMQVVLDAWDGSMTVRDLITSVLLPAQYEVGRLWHQDLLTIAEEHLVTSTTLRLLAVLASKQKPKPDNAQTVVCAAVNGNIHDVGIRAIAYLLELEGWRTISLGGDVPKSQLPAAIQFFDADVVMLSCALTTQIPDLRRSIEAIRQQADRPVRILVGGNAFAMSPNLWKELGADGHAADADGAIRLAAGSS